MKLNHPLFGKPLNLNKDTKSRNTDIYMGLMVIFMGLTGFILLLSYVIPDSLNTIKKAELPEAAPDGFEYICNNFDCVLAKSSDAPPENVFIEKDKRHITMASQYVEMQQQISAEMQYRFESFYEKWGAKIDDGAMSIQFVNPDCAKDLGNPVKSSTVAGMFFLQGSSKLSQFAQKTLRDFFPNYLKILSKPGFKEHIVEIRIEGHTSSDWRKGASEFENYVGNLKLSQERARSVITFLMKLKASKDPKFEMLKAEWPWLQKRLTANGMSSSQLQLNPDNTENKECSRRVVFRLVTDAEEQLARMLNEK